MGELLGTGSGRFLYFTDSSKMSPDRSTKELRLVKSRDELLNAFAAGVKSVISGEFYQVEFKPKTLLCEVDDTVSMSYHPGAEYPGETCANPTECAIHCTTADIEFAYDIALTLKDYLIENKLTILVSDMRCYPMRDNMRHHYVLDLLNVPSISPPFGILDYIHFHKLPLTNTDFSIAGRYRSAQYYSS